MNLFKPLLSIGLSLLTVSVFSGSLPLDKAQLQTRYGAKAELDNQKNINLRFDSPEWSAGVVVNPPASQKYWDFSKARYLAVDVENLSPTRQMRLTMHISSGSRKTSTDTKGLDHTNNTAVAVKKFNTCNTGIGLNPGEKRTMRLELPHAAIYKVEVGHGRRVIDTDEVNSIEFQMQWPYEAGMKDLVNCRLSNLRLEGDADTAAKIAADRYLPFIDVYGQYKHSEWPEKIHQDDELKAAHQKELAELKAAPETWDRFGGFANGPKRKATGSFRTEKVNGKWYFITPDGTLFWSLGIDVLRTHTDATNGRKHADWFSQPLPQDGILPFTHWNLQKKYGKADYESDFYETLNKRLRAWGINTIGN